MRHVTFLFMLPVFPLLLAAYLPGRQGDSPLPSSDPDDAVRADLVLDELGDLVDRLA